MESKSRQLLERLRRLQVEQCTRHIDQQIGLWYRTETDTLIEPTQPQQQQPPQQSNDPAAVAPAPAPEPIDIATTTSLDTATAASELLTQPNHSTITTASEPTPVETATTTTSPAVVPAVTNNTTASEPEQPSSQEHQHQSQAPNSSHSTTTTTATADAVAVAVAATTTKTTLANTSSQNHDITATIGCFLSNIKHLESFDSDATESTSSNDSYDELEDFSLEDIPPKRTSTYLHNYPHISQPPSDLRKKAIWKWANERSRLAARWTWLQAQVSDLEFRIRGQNDATVHARAYKTPPLPQKLPEDSCSRTVPISKDFRRRRLIKASQILSDSSKKLVKYSNVPCVCSSLPQTVAPCISCNGRYNYLRQLEGETMSISERISLLDPCCHPVLSFPDDLTLGSQLAYLLKQETINRRPAKGRPGRKKGSTAAKLAAAAAAAAAANMANSVGRPPGSQSSMMMMTNKLKRKYRKHSRSSNGHHDNWGPGTDRRRNKRMRRASMNEGFATGQFRPNNSSNNNNYNSTTLNSNAQNVTRRRRSEQSAYDIDNIVIPFSIAATTRVEVLEYKEIMTPSWRVWENGTHCDAAESVGEETEDTSDEAYISRHSKGETEEKKRFSLKPPTTAGKRVVA